MEFVKSKYIANTKGNPEMAVNKHRAPEYTEKHAHTITYVKYEIIVSISFQPMYRIHNEQ